MIDESLECERVLQALCALGEIFAVKLFRITLNPAPAVPLLPCLDHEAMLHEAVDPHAAVYLEQQGSPDLHELVIVPARQMIVIDTVSTLGECSPEAQVRLMNALSRHMPQYRTRVKRPSWWRGDRRVAAACRAQVTLGDVLRGSRVNATKDAIDRLQMIGTLMEKQSRVASWGVRTVMGPLLAAAGFLTYQILGIFRPRIGEAAVSSLRYAMIGALGAVFLYYGLKAVQLTGMSNRVWKRASEYRLILEERKRLARLHVAD